MAQAVAIDQMHNPKNPRRMSQSKSSRVKALAQRSNWLTQLSCGSFHDKASDILTGGTEVDTFVLGSTGHWYNDLLPFYLGDSYATITDFNRVQGDKIQLLDLGSNYSLRSGNWEGSNALDTGVFYKDDLIGVVQDTTNVSFPQAFTFV